MSTYLDLAHRATACGNQALADKLLKAAIDEVSSQTDTSLRVAAVLTELAGISREQKRYDRAENLYKRALLTYRMTIGENNPHCIEVLDALGELALERLRYGRAEQYYERACAASARCAALDPQKKAHRLRRLALIYMLRSKPDKAGDALIDARNCGGDGDG